METHTTHGAIDEEHRRKYGGSSAVEHIASPKAQAAPLRIVRS
jgi:hypothetical protein